MGNVTQEAPPWLLAVMSPGCPMALGRAATRGLGKLRERALELVQATLYLRAAECRAGREAEVSTGPAAQRSQIRESGAVTENCYSCTIRDGPFSEISAPSSCHAPLLLLLQEFLLSELSAFHTCLPNTCAEQPRAGRIIREQVSGHWAENLSLEGQDILLSQ